YKKLGLVEEAFRSLKTVQLEVRPVYHKTDDRIRSHVFLCTLAYYLQWHLKQRLEPLFAADGTHTDRQWTVRNVIERLAALKIEQIIPTKDVEEFMIGLADKALDEIEGATKEINRHKVLREFWTEIIKAMMTKTSLFQNI